MGLSLADYRRLYPGQRGPRPRLPYDRFIEKVELVPFCECWLWTAAISADGYGRFSLKGRACIPAHRAAWMLFRGGIPDSLEVAHRCDVRCCVNPNHLWLAVHQENIADRDAKRKNRQELLEPPHVKSPKGDEALKAIQAFLPKFKSAYKEAK